jgi:tRNA G18 (ribose-2'-O)-methylase SpoU
MYGRLASLNVSAAAAVALHAVARRRHSGGSATRL